MADLIDYFFQFPTKGQAQIDPIIGPLIANPGNGSEMLVYQGNISSVEPLAGYCVLIGGVSDPTLTSHPNILLINDITLFRKRLPSVVFSKLTPVSSLIIIFNAIMPYLQGLQAVTPVIAGRFLLLEGGGDLLLEDGFPLELE